MGALYWRAGDLIPVHASLAPAPHTNDQIVCDDERGLGAVTFLSTQGSKDLFDDVSEVWFQDLLI